MIKNSFSYSVRLLKAGGWNLISFELIYKLLAGAIVTPVLLLGFNLSIKAAGYDYIADDNIKEILTEPVTIIILVIILVLGAMYSLVEISSLIISFRRQRQGVTTRPVDMLRKGIRRSTGILKPVNCTMVLFIIIVIPMTGLFMSSGFMSTIKIPDFIMMTITDTPLLFTVFVLLIVAFMALMVRWIFSLHFFVLEGGTFSQSAKKSAKLIKGYYFKVILSITLWDLAIAAIFLILYGITAGISALGIIIIGEHTLALAVFLSVFRLISLVLSFIVFITSVPLSFAMITALFYGISEEKGEAEIYTEISDHSRGKGTKDTYGPVISWVRDHRKGVALAIIGVALIINGINLYHISSENIFGNVPLLGRPDITAHRGDAVAAPENTMAAFRSAHRKMADYAELDVHQTKDGVVVVCHDSNLKRTTGYDKEITKCTYKEIEQLDAGSWFSDEFKGEKIPALEEVIEYSKRVGLKLNIELKPTNDKNLEKATVDLVRKYDFEDRCTLSSLNYDSLKKVKKIAGDEIHTTYILSAAYGNVRNLPYVDTFSIEASFAREKLIESIHKAGMEVMVWTVDKEDSMKQVIKNGGDNIITDDPVRAREVIYAQDTNPDLINLLQQVLKQ